MIENSSDPHESNSEDEMSFRSHEFDPASIPQHLEQLILAKRAVKDLEEELFDRLKTENEIRKLKRASRRCPFENNGYCSNIFIRCGERQQFGVPENLPDRNKPHACNYRMRLNKSDLRVLVVDDDSLIREFCSDLLLTMGFEKENIAYAQSVADAEEKLKIAKLRNKAFHVALIDIRMPGLSGYHLVNHLVERNFNTRILLMSGYAESSEKPSVYFGQFDIIPGRKVVNHFFKKPIAFAEIAEQFQEIESELACA